VFENRVLRRIFGPKRDEVTGGWRKLHNQVMEEEMRRACSTNEEKRNAYRILVGKPERKRPLGRPKPKTYLREIGWDGVDWIYVVQHRDQWRALVNTVINLQIRVEIVSLTCRPTFTPRKIQGTHFC
jgi:hypothetical protein